MPFSYLGRKIARTTLAMASMLVVISCGETESQAGSGGQAGVAVNEVKTDVERAVQADAVAASAGSVSFSVDGSARRFDSLAGSDNYYTRAASGIRAFPRAGATESFYITFMAIDLRALDYPVALPLKRDPSRPMNPMAAMATVGFGYIDAQGVEWAGPGRIRIESFGDDGVIHGTFSDVALPHTEDQRPDITLDGSFSVRIDD